METKYLSPSDHNTTLGKLMHGLLFILPDKETDEVFMKVISSKPYMKIREQDNCAASLKTGKLHFFEADEHVVEVVADYIGKDGKVQFVPNPKVYGYSPDEWRTF